MLEKCSKGSYLLRKSGVMRAARLEQRVVQVKFERELLKLE